MLLFEELKDGTRRKNGSFEGTTGGSIVLWVIMETNKPSLGNLYCPNLLLSNFTTFIGENGVFDELGRPEIRSNDGLFGRAAYGSIVLDAMVEKNKPLLDTIPCSSRSLSDFTNSAKIAPFPYFFSVPRPARGGGRDL